MGRNLFNGPPSPLITFSDNTIESNSETHPRRCYFGGIGALVESARELMEDPKAEVHCVNPLPFGLERTGRLQISSDSDLLPFNWDPDEKHSTDPRCSLLKDSLLFQKKLNKAIFYATEEIPFVHSGRIKHLTPSPTSLGRLQQLEEIPNARKYLSSLELRTQTLFRERNNLLCFKEEGGGYIKPFAHLLISLYLQHTYPTRFHLHRDRISTITVDSKSKKHRVTFGSDHARNPNQIFDSLIATTCQRAPLEIQPQDCQLAPLWETRPIVEAYSLWTMSIAGNELEKRLNTELKTDKQIKNAIKHFLPWQTDSGLMATPLAWRASVDQIHVTAHISTRVMQDSFEKTQQRIQSYLDNFTIGEWEMLSGSVEFTAYDTTPSSDIPEALRPIWMNWGPLELSLAGARVNL
jgi:hypothetical protein